MTVKYTLVSSDIFALCSLMEFNRGEKTGARR